MSGVILSVGMVVMSLGGIWRRKSPFAECCSAAQLIELACGRGRLIKNKRVPVVAVMLTLLLLLTLPLLMLLLLLLPLLPLLLPSSRLRQP